MQAISTGHHFWSLAPTLPAISLQPQPVGAIACQPPTPFGEPIAGLYTRELDVREVFDLLFSPERH